MHLPSQRSMIAERHQIAERKQVWRCCIRYGFAHLFRVVLIYLVTLECLSLVALFTCRCSFDAGVIFSAPR